MKKNIFIFISLTIIIILIYNTNFSLTKPKILSSTNINNYLYSYKTTKEIKDFTIDNNNIFYISDNKLYYQNLYEPNPKLINKISSSCSFKNQFIICNKTLYDLYLKKLYKANESIIPYKDIYLKFLTNKILFNNITYKNLNNNYELINYFYTKNNTYLLLKLNNLYYLYNLNKDTYEEINYSNYNIYNDGFYFYNENNYLIYNLKTNIKTTYQNFTKRIPNISTYSNNIIYSYNHNYLEIINLKNRTIKILDLKYNIHKLIFNNNYLYFISNNDIYYLNLTKLDLSNVSNYQEILNNKDIKYLKDTYNLNIYTKNETNIEYPDFKAEVETNDLTINKALNIIEPILTNYNKEFFNTFYDNNYEGLNIYLTSTLTPSDYETQIANPAAYSLINNNKYTIVMDINEESLNTVFCHELFHNIEFNLNNHNYYFDKWDNYNPQDFIYNNSYTSKYIYNYTLEENDKDKVYFIDYYSHTFPEEDRARIFEKTCTNFNLKEYPNLYQKLLYLNEMLKKILK